MTVHLPAECAEPYVYLDSRALVLSNGRHGVIFHRAQGRWLAETLRIVAEEQRATRILQHRLFGGFVDADGAVVLFAGTHDDTVSVRLSASAFAALRAELGSG
jgi:hypothetical protein